MLGSHAACSEQMPACEDSHQSSHTEADCAGAVSQQQRNKCRTPPPCADLVCRGPRGGQRCGRREAREGCHKEARLEVVFGMKIHILGHVLNFIPESLAILAFSASHTRGQ